MSNLCRVCEEADLELKEGILPYRYKEAILNIKTYYNECPVCGCCDSKNEHFVQSKQRIEIAKNEYDLRHSPEIGEFVKGQDGEIKQIIGYSYNLYEVGEYHYWYQSYFTRVDYTPVSYDWLEIEFIEVDQ